MRAQRDDRPAPDPEAGRRRGIDPAADPGPDFAEEHESLTFADEMPGGPEGVAEPESPKGYAGMDERGRPGE